MQIQLSADVGVVENLTLEIAVVNSQTKLKKLLTSAESWAVNYPFKTTEKLVERKTRRLNKGISLWGKLLHKVEQTTEIKLEYLNIRSIIFPFSISEKLFSSVYTL